MSDHLKTNLTGLSQDLGHQIEAAWLVSQHAGEFNPIHNHSTWTLSSIIYLQVPDNRSDDRRACKTRFDGYFEWVDRSADPMQNSTLGLEPEADMFYVFPASLLHLVYPFKSREERRGVSINATHQL